MKKLYINNILVDITDDVYIPFTHTIDDLENPTSIGIPATKQIILPSTVTNDEVFGYICNLNRQTHGFVDAGVGINFNQTKKTTYELYNDSELITAGLVMVDSITDAGYSITLYDNLAKFFDLLQAKKLNECELYTDLTGSTVYSHRMNAWDIWNMNGGSTPLTTITPITPVFNIKEFKQPTTKLRVTYFGDTIAHPQTVDTPETTPLAVGSYKSNEVEFAIPINNVIHSINKTVGDYIQVDSGLTSLFNEVNILGTPFVNPNIQYHNTIDETAGTKVSYTESGDYYDADWDFVVNKVGTSDNLLLENSNVGGTLRLEYKVKADGAALWYTTFYKDGSSTTYNASTPDGTIIGENYAKIRIKYYDSTTYKTETKDIDYVIPLIKGDNITFVSVAGVLKYCLIRTDIPIYFKNYPQIFDLNGTSNMIPKISVKIFNSDTEFTALNKHTSFFQTDLFSFDTCKMTSTTQFDVSTQDELRTGYLLTGKNLYPKVTCRDFLISVAKYFNLCLINDYLNNKIIIKKKSYYITPDLLMVDSISEVNVGLITFDKLKYNYGLPTYQSITDYQTNVGEPYGEQIIQTGYNIKENIQTETFNNSVPVLIYEPNSFGYNEYNKYRNSGFNRWRHGITTSLTDKITFGFLNRVEQQITIADDSWYEANMKKDTTQVVGALGEWDSAVYPESEEFVMTRRGINYDSTTGVYIEELDYGAGDYEYRIPKYYTFSPYKFNSGIVELSLEMNKPVYNFANLNDTTYPQTSIMYEKCHKKMLSDKYNPDTHIIKCRIYINGQIDIYKIYNLNNNYYIISNINEYDMLKPDVYEVELLRVNNYNNYINYNNL